MCIRDSTIAVLNLTVFQSTQPSRVETSLPPLMLITGAFQSTQPSRVETTQYHSCSQPNDLSIHSTLTGWDNTRGKYQLLPDAFNPLNPHGLRRQITAVFPKILPTFSTFFWSHRNLLTSCHNYGYSCKKFWCERPGNFMFTCLSHQVMHKFFGKIIALSHLEK